MPTFSFDAESILALGAVPAPTPVHTVVRPAHTRRGPIVLGPRSHRHHGGGRYF